MAGDQVRKRADRLLKRLTQLGIVTFLVISAFDIHRWRREPWQVFELGFDALAGHIFGQPQQPVWLYALAFPFVAVNFACHVQLLRGRRKHVLPLLLVSAAGIALMPLAASQTLVARMIWEQILTALGYAIGGAIALILALKLDSRSAAAKSAASSKDT